jgi:hypothetical protein
VGGGEHKVTVVCAQEYLKETGTMVEELALTPTKLVECLEFRQNRDISATALR